MSICNNCGFPRLGCICPTVRAVAKDEADIASEQEQYARDEALWRVGKPSRLQLRGSCYNCRESIEGLFCDVGCREDYEKRQKLEHRLNPAATDDKQRKLVREVLRLKKPWLGSTDPQLNQRQERQPSERRSEPRGEYDAQTNRSSRNGN